MKKVKKILMLVLCAALLVGATVAGTYAYLTSKAEVENTFTAGQVVITLQEYEVDAQTGKKSDVVADAGLQNIELVPGRVIEKNPFITVDANSESCWLFVKIENGLGNSVTINGMEDWVSLGDGYYRYQSVAGAGQVIPVFASITCGENADFAAVADKTIVITAYAVQSEGVSADVAFETAKTLG